MSPSPSVSNLALYRAVMKEAAGQGKTLMERMVGRASPAMLQRAPHARSEFDKRQIAEAAHMLARHESVLCDAYPLALLDEFAQAVAGAARKSGPVSFDALELMGEEQMQESIELVRLQQSVLGNAEMELAELNTLVCAVQGLKNVQADRNPLRPEAYVRSLRTVVQQCAVPPGIRIRWLQGLGDALAIELVRVYVELSGFLQAQGVIGSAFLVTPAAANASAGARSAASAEAAGSQHAALLNVRELRRLLSGDFDAPAADEQAGMSAGPATEFSATVPAAYEALHEMRQVDKAIQRLRERQAPGGAGEAALHEQLRRQTQGAGQALGLEVVNLMVENIASDARLLPPVQQAVRDLEPALLRLALVDPRFFSDRKHPARRLLDQVTQRSLAWNSADSPGFAAFMDVLRQAIEVLLSTRAEGAGPFDFAVQTLEGAWGEQQQRDRRYREKAVRSLLQAEQRNLLAERIAREMRQRDDAPLAPREVAAFVTGPWSQVMAQARLADDTGDADPGGFAGIVGDLIWSAQPHTAGANAARLARIIPELVLKLRAGLAAIDYPEASTNQFLAYLTAAHVGAVNGAPTALAPSADDADAGPWLAPAEAQQSAFLDTQLTPEPNAAFAETQVLSGDTQGGAGEQAIPESAIQPGAWVDLNLNGTWDRYEVTWASPHGSLYMFANAAGKPHSMTKRMMEKMLQAGSLRLFSSQAVVDGALDAVAEKALSNSLDVQL